jgi:UDP-N-acetylmuramoylalanine--D-glutamate ligase
MFMISGFEGKTVAVFGLGATGLSAARALAAGGAMVAAWDDKASSRDKARALGFDPVDLEHCDFRDFAALVLSPGVPLTHPAPHWSVSRATGAGIPVLGDTELFVRALAASGREVALVAITGTNGKSTTTALIGHLLASAGRDARVGGNIGTAVLDLDPPADGAVYVVEFSSYQIDLTPSLHPKVAVLLNLSPDHLDRHGDMAHYAAVKARIFARQEAGDTAVVGVDDGASAAIADGIAAGPAVVRISNNRSHSDGICVEAGQIYEVTGGERRLIADLDGIGSLRGTHNWQNAAAAVAVARALGLAPSDIAAGLRTFPGLAHRMEEVGRKDGVLFINDSKATNADAAARALASFDVVYWIAGGQAKADGIVPLSDYFPKIVRAYLIGEAARDFGRTLDGKVDAVHCGTLDRAVTLAAADATAAGGGERAVLLSPACASFDQFANFEARGEAFRSLVAALDGVAMKQEVAA